MPRPEKEGLLTRWSRLKRESTGKGDQRGKPSTTPAAAPTGVSAGEDVEAGEKAGTEALPELPSLESLTPDSDFEAFMDPRVEDGVRRAALKTLFRSPGFNITDGLDEYAGDYTKLETLTPAMVAALKHTQRTLFGKQAERGDTGSDDSGDIQSDAMRSTDEDQSLANHGDEHGGHAQGGGKDHGVDENHGVDEPGGESAGGIDTATAMEDLAGDNAGERSSAKDDGKAGSKRNA